MSELNYDLILVYFHFADAFKATYNWGIHKVINLEEANTKSQALFK